MVYCLRRGATVNTHRWLLLIWWKTARRGAINLVSPFWCEPSFAKMTLLGWQFAFTGWSRRFSIYHMRNPPYKADPMLYDHFTILFISKQVWSVKTLAKPLIRWTVKYLARAQSSRKNPTKSDSLHAKLSPPFATWTPTKRKTGKMTPFFWLVFD